MASDCTITVVKVVYMAVFMEVRYAPIIIMNMVPNTVKINILYIETCSDHILAMKLTILREFERPMG